MKRFITALSILLSLFSCVDYSSDWVKVYEQPDFTDFVGEWKMIEPTYKNLEEESGLTIQRSAELVIRKDSTFTLKGMPSIFDLTRIYSPEHYITLSGRCSFDDGQGFWWLWVHFDKNIDMVEEFSTNIKILKHKENSILRLKHTRIDETAIVFEKVE